MSLVLSSLSPSHEVQAAEEPELPSAHHLWYARAPEVQYHWEQAQLATHRSLILIHHASQLPESTWLLLLCATEWIPASLGTFWAVPLSKQPPAVVEQSIGPHCDDGAVVEPESDLEVNALDLFTQGPDASSSCRGGNLASGLGREVKQTLEAAGGTVKDI